MSQPSNSQKLLWREDRGIKSKGMRFLGTLLDLSVSVYWIQRINHHVSHSVYDTGPASWYISQNGTDSPECGRHEESACATFPGLWQHLVRKNAENNKVITNTDLIIENLLLHSPDQKVTFQNSAFDMINITIINTTIEETFLEFNGSNISLRIENSLIRPSTIAFFGFSLSDPPVVIRHCTFDGHPANKNNSISLDLRKFDRQAFLSFLDTNVELVSCDFSRIEYNDATNSVIDCSSSNITIVHVSASGIKGYFVDTIGCNVLITNSHFRNNSGEIVICVHHGKLGIENVHFLNNTSKYETIFLERSEGHVINSTLIGNQGKYAGGIFLDRSEAHVINSTLIGNEGERTGGIRLCDSDAQVINSTLTGNKGRDGGALTLYLNSHVTTERCYFLENVATEKGGAAFVDSECEYQDTDSVFADNTAREGGKTKSDAIFAQKPINDDLKRRRDTKIFKLSSISNDIF